MQVERGFPVHESDRVYINKVVLPGFVEVWKYEVGAYQVCQKWIKDRRGRVLDADDVAHYCQVLAAFQQTITVMEDIERAIQQCGGWPL